MLDQVSAAKREFLSFLIEPKPLRKYLKLMLLEKGFKKVEISTKGGVKPIPHFRFSRVLFTIMAILY